MKKPRFFADLFSARGPGKAWFRHKEHTMNNRRFFSILAVSLLGVSCDDFLKTDGRAAINYDGLDRRTFWAQNIQNESFYQTTAVRLYEGEKCVIWVEETNSKVTEETAKAIAGEYDTNIAKPIVDIFGMEEIHEDGKRIGNSLEYADYLTDGDGKLTILLLDIRDGYSSGAASYTAGYFTAGNFYSRKDHPHSNEADMIYIDTSPGVPGSQDSNATFAHELQHLINSSNRIYIKQRDSMNALASLDTWIDEGLSLAAENVYLQDHQDMRYGWFIDDTAGTISRGNNFFVWNNHQDERNAIMDEYATAYLFFQWLRLQSGDGYGIYKTIAASNSSNENAVLDAAQKHFEEKEYAADWETLLRTWMAANYMNRSSGVFGYRNEKKLNEVRVRAIGGSTQSLYPGEGVYSAIRNGSVSPAATGGNIKYGGLTKTSATGTPDFAGPSYSGTRLLTFNSNSNPQGSSETGNLAGGSADRTAVTAAGSRQVWPASQPLPIDARDISGSFRQEERDRLRRFGKAGTHAAK